MEKELREQRQEELYRFIYERSTLYGLKTTQKEICEYLSQYYTYNEDITAHDHCTMLWTDIKDLNERKDSIIISNNFVYWIGNEEETKAYIEKLWKALTPRLSRYWKLAKKFNLHNHGKLPLTDNESIEFIEAYKDDSRDY